MTAIHGAPLACPTCEYDLRGSDGPLCPECGTRFDKERLREWWESRELGPLWERRPSLPSFVATWLTVVVCPVRFARQFRARPDPRRARLFAFICFAVGAAIFVAIGGPATKTGWLGPLGAIGGLSGMAICEFVLARLLTLLGPPRFAPPGTASHPFWLGLCCYTGAFAVLTGVWGAVGMIVHANWRFLLDELIWYAAATLIFLWWWVGLGTMVAARARGAMRKIIGVVLIPIVGGLSIGVGYGAAVVATFANPG